MADSTEPKLNSPAEQLPTPEPEAPPSREAEPGKETEPGEPEVATEKEGAAPTPEPARLRLKPKKAMPIPQLRDEVTIRIEKIMEEGVADAYSRLSPIAKEEFKLKGEETARNIRELLKSTHVKVKKILRLILEWLKLLPGVNRFFLEQEAKIKTDKIIGIKR